MIQTLFEAIGMLFNSFWFWASFTAIAFIFVFYYTKHKKVLIISLFLAVLMAVALKEFFAQARPCVETGATVCNTVDIGGFPSAHATISTMLALGALGTVLFYPMAFFAIVISLSRLWIGVHTIPQVLGGFALAVMVYIAVFHLNQKLYGDYPEVDMQDLFDENLMTKKVE